MRHARRRCLEIDVLEGKTLLSATAASFVGPMTPAEMALERSHFATATQQMSAAQSTTITGTVSGTYRASTAANGSMSYTFAGSGTVSPFGNVSMSATVSSNDSVYVSGQATGTLVLSNGSGSVTMSITGPAGNMASHHPDVFQYTITGATGSFQGMSASGYVDFAVSPTTTGASEQGTFQVSFIRNGSPPPP